MALSDGVAAIAAAELKAMIITATAGLVHRTRRLPPVIPKELSLSANFCYTPAMIRTSSGMSARPDTAGAADEALDEAMTESINPNGGIAVVFTTGHHAPYAAQAAACIRRRARVRTVFGCTGAGIIGPRAEIEQSPGLAILLFDSDRVSAQAAILPRVDPDESIPMLKQEIPSLNRDRGVLIVAVDPKHVNASFLPKIAEAFPETPVIGAAAGWCSGGSDAALIVDGEIASAGAAALHISGCLDASIGVAQSVLPESRPAVITQAADNVIARIDSSPAADVLGQFVNDRQSQSPDPFEIFCAIASSPEDFESGRYMVRNIIGVEPKSKNVSIAAVVRDGQFIAFGVRSPKNARRNFRQMLERLNSARVSRAPRAAIMFNCAARGASLYGRPNVDLDALREFYPDIPVVGLFGFAEIGPIAWAGRKVRSAILNHTAVVSIFSEPLEALGAT